MQNGRDDIAPVTRVRRELIPFLPSTRDDLAVLERAPLVRFPPRLGRGPDRAELLDGVPGERRVERVVCEGEGRAGGEGGPEGVDGEDVGEGKDVAPEEEEDEDEEDEGEVETAREVVWRHWPGDCNGVYEMKE